MKKGPQTEKWKEGWMKTSRHEVPEGGWRGWLKHTHTCRDTCARTHTNTHTHRCWWVSRWLMRWVMPIVKGLIKGEGLWQWCIMGMKKCATWMAKLIHNFIFGSLRSAFGTCLLPFRTENHFLWHRRQAASNVRSSMRGRRRRETASRRRIAAWLWITEEAFTPTRRFLQWNSNWRRLPACFPFFCNEWKANLPWNSFARSTACQTSANHTPNIPTVYYIKLICDCQPETRRVVFFHKYAWRYAKVQTESRLYPRSVWVRGMEELLSC